MMPSSGRSSVYQIYGVHIKSHWPLPGREEPRADLAEVELFGATAAVFSEASQKVKGRSGGESWFRRVQLPDGSDYLWWPRLFEFLISPDGRRIACRELNGASPEAFQTYLLGQVLSFALLKQGIEPLHATAIVIDGKAVAFVGDCGYGKSSLGAAFLQVGYPLLTDDLLILEQAGDQFVAYPGPPRIKLFPRIAESLLGKRVIGAPMNNQTPKLVISLGQNGKMHSWETFPMKAIFVLTPPTTSSPSPRITIRRLSAQHAFVQMLRGTFNTIVVEPARLERQFDLATRLATRVPVRSLSYPRDLNRISEVRKSILRELAE